MEALYNKVKTILDKLSSYRSAGGISEDAKAILGEVKNITALFVEFQKHLYEGVEKEDS